MSPLERTPFCQRITFFKVVGSIVPPLMVATPMGTVRHLAIIGFAPVFVILVTQSMNLQPSIQWLSSYPGNKNDEPRRFSGKAHTRAIFLMARLESCGERVKSGPRLRHAVTSWLD